MVDSKKKRDPERELDQGMDSELDHQGRDRELDRDPIIAELRRLYEGVVDEPLPDDLLELLRKLDEVERNR